MNWNWVKTSDLEIPGEKCFLEQKLSADFSEVLVNDVGKTNQFNTAPRWHITIISHCRPMTLSL